MTLPNWSAAAATAEAAVPDDSIDAAWRALNYLCVAQLYLRENVLLHEEILPSHIKAEPRGHWGVCPPVTWVLAHLAAITANRPSGSELILLHGAGHAATAVLAHSYLSGTLPDEDGGSSWSTRAVTALAAGFPQPERFGSEITPLIPGVRHTGGQLGPALAIAQGMVLDAPQRLVVPLIGDGECETGATAAAWLARRSLRGKGHGAVLPVVLLNGLRMGGPSLLATLTTDEVRDYFRGLGYTPLIHEDGSVASFRALLRSALDQLVDLGHVARPPVIVLMMPKGQTGPVEVGGQLIAGTPAIHKTPLRDPRADPEDFDALRRWLVSYRPHELFGADGSPSAQVQAALPKTACVTNAAGAVSVKGRQVDPPAGGDVNEVLIERAAAGGFRVFSPDELASNRILSPGTVAPAWTTEILNEEICHAWLQGYTETGRDALLATYDAFAPINASLLVQHIKHERMRSRRGDIASPSINYLLTSLGWNNTYTHQNPGLMSVLLDLEYSQTRLYTPADGSRAAAVLQRMLVDRGHCNILVAGKHPIPPQPQETLFEEIRTGAAIWPHLTQPGPVDLVVASAGDVPAREMSQAAVNLRGDFRIRYVHVNDLTVLGSPHIWSHALSDSRFRTLFGTTNPVLMATTGFPSGVRGLIAGRGDGDRFHVVGYQDLGHPMSAQDLLDQSGVSAAALSEHALTLLKKEHAS